MLYSEFINQTVSNRNRIRWNYYGNSLRTNNILQKNNSKNFIHDYFRNGAKNFSLLANPEIARNYIENYFTAARKEYVLSFNYNEQYQLPPERTIHTVSAFFLGLLIENCLTGTNTLHLKSENDFPFVYFWFLTCLYHDYGYCVTERENLPIQFPETASIPKSNCNVSRIHPSENRTLAQVKKVLGIELSPFSSFSARFSANWKSSTEPILERALIRELIQCNNIISEKAKLCFNTHAKICSHQYHYSTIVRYFNYCINERKRVDHGIVGGYLFYDRMVKNYMLSYMALLQECDYIPNLSDFEYANRHFCKEQITIFSYIADCVLAHNIFKQSIDKRQLYEDYKLEELLAENYKIITFDENPLLYILAVTDSIEPTKVYKNISPQQIADAINIEYQPQSRTIKIYSLSDAIDINEMYIKAKELEDWTGVRCSDVHDGEFILEI